MRFPGAHGEADDSKLEIPSVLRSWLAIQQATQAPPVPTTPDGGASDGHHLFSSRCCSGFLGSGPLKRICLESLREFRRLDTEAELYPLVRPRLDGARHVFELEGRPMLA